MRGGPAAGARATAMRIMITVAITNGTLMAKIQRQLAVSTSQPPSSGPMTMAIPDHAVHEPIAAAALVRREGRDDHRQRARRQQRAEHALQRAPATSTSIVGASAHSTLTAPKPATPMVKIRRSP